MYFGMNYIDGSFCPHRSDFEADHPYNQEAYGMFPQSTKEEVKEAVDSAKKAFKEWKKVSRVQRSDLFDKLAQLVKEEHENLVKIISEETGKNLNESHAEVVEALHMIQVVAGSGRQAFGEVLASELPTKDVYVTRKPKGVVAVVSPWNFPLAIGSTWCSAPAILEGNCVVHKPSEETPYIAQFIATLYDKAGFPSGVYNLVHGDGEVGKELVEADVDCILFTGSAEVGQSIRRHCADTWHKTCSCELGSKSAVITFEDGDLDLAVDVSLASAFKLSGQRCVSSGRLLVQRSVVEEFKKKFVEAVQEKATTGSPFEEPAPFYGPLINESQAEKVKKYNQMVKIDADATVLLDCCVADKPGGNFIKPLVYTCEWGDKPFLKQEVFGPHVAIIPFDDLEDAIKIYNDTPYGLALGVVTDDFRKMRTIRDECDTGMLYLNGGSIAAESHVPFGGVGKSGNGYKSAVGTYRAVTEEIAVTVNYEEGKMQFAQGMK
jgi:aldehyde dehydrogenase (NAD+)